MEDLSVKVAGGEVRVERLYHADAWRFEHEKDHLRFHWDVLGEEVLTIDKGGVTYIHKAQGSPLYVNDTFERNREPSGYLWKTKYGKWKSFDENGHPAAFGSTNEVIGTYLYQAGGDGRGTGIADRKNDQVIWFEYDAEGRLATARDVSNRTATYGYRSGRIASVRDVLGYVTHYEPGRVGARFVVPIILLFGAPPTTFADVPLFLPRAWTHGTWQHRMSHELLFS